MNDTIFGYTWEEIQIAQQGGRLGRVIDTSKPAIDDSAIEESDLKLLAQYGERKLRDMGYIGVIDRLERGGHLSSNTQVRCEPVQPHSEPGKGDDVPCEKCGARGLMTKYHIDFPGYGMVLAC